MTRRFFSYDDPSFVNDRFGLDKVDLGILSLNPMKYDLDHCSLPMLKSYSKDPLSFHLEDSPQMNPSIIEDNRISYVSNSYGHRSDEFQRLDKDKVNILFAGCSQTFGLGLPVEETWPSILYKWMKENHSDIDFGPYQALSFTGGSIEKIVQNIFKYCHLFGNPNIIYFLAPDIDRQIGYGLLEYPGAKAINDVNFIDHVNMRTVTKEELGSGKVEQVMSAEASILRSVSTLRMLEIFCISNNIELIWNTWGPEDDLYRMIDFKKFRSDTELSEKMFYALEEKEMLLPKSKYENKARDLMHDGYAVQRYFANKMYSWYIELFVKQ
jgi:hypothetical protein